MIDALSPLEALELARKELPMDRLFAQYGMGEFVDPQAAKQAKCPWCGQKGKLGIRHLETFWVFNCFQTGCDANIRSQGKDEVGFIALKEGVDRKAGFHRYLELTQVRIVSADKPKRRATRKPPTEPPKNEAEKPAGDGEPPQAPLEALFVGGGGGGGGDEPPAAVAPAASAPKRSIWEAFLSKLTLSDKDRTALKKERGFSDETIDALRFRSNNRRNEIALNSLTTEFSKRELLASGLFKRDKTGAMAIETQFTGFGLISKTKNEKGKTEEKWGQVERPLIPYLDERALPWVIRPHKGNIAKPDRDDDESCGGHVFSPYLLATRLAENDGKCVLTESEFKAAALWQCGLAAIGIPGTSFVRNWAFRRELVRLLERYRVTDLVIAFDNEAKNIPHLPGYKADPWDRHDTAVWARYIAWDLMKKTPRPPLLETVRIAYLPDEWRTDAAGKETGKADWDSALAKFVTLAGGDVKRGTTNARAAFEKVVDEAASPNEFLDMFPDETQRIITVKLNHLFHEPLLRSGGKKEEQLARRFDRVHRADEEDDAREIAGLARGLSRSLRSVNGTYYTLKLPSEKRYAKLKKMKSDINEALEKMGTNGNYDDEIERLKLERRLIKEALNGNPEPISNFTLRCDYCLHTSEGRTERMMRFSNNQGEHTRLLRVPGAAFSRLADWRQFCNERTQGVAAWRGAEKDLQALVEDLKTYSAFRDIYEVNSYGLHKQSGIWFFGDVAYSPTGETLLLDENNVFWHAGIGYQIDESKDLRGSNFDQGAPFLLDASYRGKDCHETDDMGTFIGEWLNEMYLATGGYDGLLTIGMMLAYGAAPEVFRDEGCHPGVWLYGKRGGGKNTIARWLMRMWGFNDINGVRLDEGTTAVAMQRGLMQYSFLPFFFDEYRRDIDAKREGVLRGAFDRNITSKGRMDGGESNKTRQARPLTTPLVGGESSSNDAATRSRYCHLLVATARRERNKEKERFDRLQVMSHQLHRVGRFIMENRAQFVEATLKRLNRWLALPLVSERIPERRTRVVHGLGFAALYAFHDCLGISFLPEEKFIEFLIEHSEQALHDVQEETMINKFWSALISGLQRGAIKKDFFQIKDVQFDDNGKMIQEKRCFELNGKKIVKVLCIAAQPAFDEYARDIASRRLDAPLSKTDIQREISKEDYFVQNPEDSTRVHRVSMNGSRLPCWVLRMDNFPYGPELSDALTVEADNAA